MNKNFPFTLRNFFYIFGIFLIAATVFNFRLQRLQTLVFEGNYSSLSGDLLRAQGIFVRDGHDSSGRLVQAEFEFDSVKKFEKIVITIPPTSSGRVFYIDNLKQEQSFVSGYDFQRDLEAAQGTVGLKILARRSLRSSSRLESYEIEYRYPIYSSAR